MIGHKKIILASQSPRRQQFLKELGLDFEIRLKAVNEVYPEHLQAQEITDFLASLKADAYELEENEILITSDTIVWLEGKALGKPKNYEQAYQMISDLSGKTHEVISSVCLKSSEKKHIFHDITKVSFKELTPEIIEHYITNYKPYDKAGGYGIQEWIGLVGIHKIEGSYTNVVGLPTQKLYQELLWFIK